MTSPAKKKFAQEIIKRGNNKGDEIIKEMFPAIKENSAKEPGTTPAYMPTRKMKTKSM